MPKAITSDKIEVVGARLSFANLDVPKFFGAQPKPNETPKYRATLLLDPSNPQHAEAIRKIKEQAQAISMKFWDGNIPKSLEKCYGLGNDLDKVYDGFKDMFYIRLSSNDAVPVVGRNREGPVDPKTGRKAFIPLKKGDKEWPFNGSYVNSKLTLWTQDAHGRKAVNGNLLAVQFAKAGPEFGRASANPDDEFDQLPDDTGAGAKDETSSMFD